MSWIGIAGIAGVSLITGAVMWWLNSIDAPVWKKTLAALIELWAAPFGAVLIRGLARLTIADEQSLNA